MGSEFSKLLDLALQKGKTSTELLTTIQNRIKAQYLAENPGALSNIQISIDLVSGRIRIYEGGIDVTLPDFQLRAESLAREILVNAISEGPRRMQEAQPAVPVQQAVSAQQAVPLPPPPPPPIPPAGFDAYLTPSPSGDSMGTPSGQSEKLPNPFIAFKERIINTNSIPRLTRLAFWTYHGGILLAIYLMIFSLADAEFRDQFSMLIRSQSLLENAPLLFSALVPLLSLMYVVRKKVNSDTRELGLFFLLLEVPLLTILLAASFIGVSTIPRIAILAGILMVPVVLYIDRHHANHEEHQEAPYAQSMRDRLTMFMQHYAFVTVAYLTLIVTFYVPKIISSLMYMFSSAFRPEYTVGMGYYSSQTPISLKLLVLATCLVATMLTLLPYLLTAILAKRFIKIDIQKVKLGQASYLLVSIILFVGLVFGSSIFVAQNNRYKNLLTFIQSTDYEERERIARDVNENRHEYEKLVDAEKHGTFYLQTPFYEHRRVVFLNLLNPMFKYLAGPFLKSADINEVRNALYQIIPSQGYQHMPPRSLLQVQLDSRTFKIATDPAEPLAQVTMDESYASYSNTDQEVIHEFVLPNDAVITDLKLGPDLEYQGIIAPRGAAQTTYVSQVQRQRDPALLEQIGPRMYRLRVYPIPARNSATLSGRNQRVSFTYTTGLTPMGVGLPEFLPTTQTYPINTNATLFELDGNKIVNTSEKDTYFKHESITNRAQAYCNKINSNNLLLSVSNKGISCANGSRTVNLKGKKIAILLDTILSSTAPAHEQLKVQLKENTQLLENNTVELVPFESFIGKPRSLTPSTIDSALDVTYFGNLSGASLYSQQRAARELSNQGYDAIIAFQRSHYGDRLTQLLGNGTVPVLIVGAEGTRFSDIQYAQFLQSNEYFVDDVQDAFAHIAILENSKVDNRALIISKVWFSNAVVVADELKQRRDAVQADGLLEGSEETITNELEKDTPAKYRPDKPIVKPKESKKLEESENLEEPEKPPYLQSRTPLANKEAIYISLLMQDLIHMEGENARSLTFIDELHRISEHYYVMSPYSSFLALVNEQQLALLYAEIQKQNRYDDNIVFRNLPARETAPRDSMSAPQTSVGRSEVGIDSSRLWRTALPGPISGSNANNIMLQESNLSFGVPRISFPVVATYGFLAVNMGILGLVVLAFIVKSLMRAHRKSE